MEIFKKLESLGFFEWLKEKGFGSGFTAMILDAQPFDSIERGGYNAIAFRWFREKHWLYPSVISHDVDNHIFTITGEKLYESDDEQDNFETFEEAELECLKKLIQIVKNK